MKKESKPIEYK